MVRRGREQISNPTLIESIGRRALLFLLLGLSCSVAQAQTPPPNFNLLYNFTGGSDGANPYSALVEDSAGNLYGTTYNGGQFSFGAVFQITPSGTERVLYSFTGGNDGANPYGSLILDAAGDLYGTTFSGGKGFSGTVFEVSATGTETVLYDFGTSSSDGANPAAGLIRDTAGNFYGTTSASGAGGCGNVFKLTPGGTETILYAFAGGADGCTPLYGKLAVDTAGNLYGNTTSGGTFGVGVVFKLAINKTTGKVTETILHSFGSGTDGFTPYGDLVLKSGFLFGTTFFGGTGTNGTVYKLAASTKVETILYNFLGTADGCSPQAGVILDSSNNLYGTTTSCGVGGSGTVYRLSATGQLTTLHGFSSTGSEGTSPSGTLLRDTKGDLFGTADFGGSSSSGTVWSLTPVVDEVTTTTLTSSPNPSQVAQNVTFTATVTASGRNGTPVGTVRFQNGSIVLATVNLTSGEAQYSTSTLTKGNHTIYAIYSGKPGYFKSSSTHIVQTVK